MAQEGRYRPQGKLQRDAQGSTTWCCWMTEVSSAVLSQRTPNAEPRQPLKLSLPRQKEGGLCSRLPTSNCDAEIELCNPLSTGRLPTVSDRSPMEEGLE